MVEPVRRMPRAPLDAHRPVFHVRPRSGWVNDPNAPIQVDGRYHLFCQHNPAGSTHGNVHWAHFSSTDLVHWTTHPIALTPSPGGPDADGCWSGSAVLVDGRPWLVYSGFLDGAAHQSVCVARPSADLLHWQCEPAAAVLSGGPPQEDLAVFRDPFLWRQDDGFRMLVGAGTTGGAGAVLQYRSSDPRSWEYLGPLLTADHLEAAQRRGEVEGADGPVDTGEAWECPQLLRHGDRGLLVLSAWRAATGPSHVCYVSGRLQGDRLLPERTGCLDAGPDFYAPALTVDESGRCLLWGWSWEARDPTLVHAAGWAGVLTSPRVVSLDPDGAPVVQPVPELSLLRGTGSARQVAVRDGAEHLLDAGAGRALDLQVRLQPSGGGRAWVRVLADAGAEEYTEIGVDAAAGELYLARERSSTDPGCAGGTFRMPVALDTDGGVEVRILVDVSLIEVFAQGGSLTARVYPMSGHSTALLAGGSGTGTGTVHARWWPMRAAEPGTSPSP